jgi:eukaryotic-like serine/threonine-protein kinase
MSSEGGAAPRTEPPPAVPGYQTTVSLGRGGYATVWLAWRRGVADFQVPVALKLLDREHAQNEAACRRFLAEARLLAQLQHPNLVDVIDAGTYGGRPYYVMVFVRGTSLARLLTSQSRLLPLDASLFLGARVAAALHAVHTAIDAFGQPLGVVHRDVNPTNILIGRHGVIKLIDFGIATSHLGPRETRVNVVKGNPRYLSPEQAFGLEADARSDLYGLALTLYEAITGRAPLASKDPAEALAVAREPVITPPSFHRPSVSPELDRVLMRALARAPDQRFATLEGFARALQACLAEVNPIFVAESLDLLLQQVDLGEPAPPREGTQRVAEPARGAREEEVPTSIWQRPSLDDDDEPTRVEEPEDREPTRVDAMPE